MSAVDSTESFAAEPMPLERAAAAGELPLWACASPERRAHMGRVAGLMSAWAQQLALPAGEEVRWTAAGWLHDVLRDADPAELRAEVPSNEQDLPGAVLHGPAAAYRLAGAVDSRVATAVHYHTLGHPSLDRLGRALYLADFLDPNRPDDRQWREALRARMPGDLDEVTIEVAAYDLQDKIERRLPIRPETAAFWSALVGRKRG